MQSRLLNNKAAHKDREKSPAASAAASTLLCCPAKSQPQPGLEVSLHESIHWRTAENQMACFWRPCHWHWEQIASGGYEVPGTEVIMPGQRGCFE